MVKALTTTGTSPPVAPTRALLTRTVRRHAHRHYRSAQSMSEDMTCTPGHPNMWQQVAGQSSASLKYHPPAPNHREHLVFMDRQKKVLPSSSKSRATAGNTAGVAVQIVRLLHPETRNQMERSGSAW
uniref:Uncharacterized protein n=1 Tax=Eutreptiella gymnastica TaxID=73025 RepID=A0A7S4FQU6_9EUGL